MTDSGVPDHPFASAPPEAPPPGSRGKKAHSAPTPHPARGRAMTVGP